MSVIGPIIRLVVEAAVERLDWITVPHEDGSKKVTVWNQPYELRKLTVGWARTPAIGVVQDLDMCTFHFLNLTGGNPDASWIASDYTTIEAGFDSLWTSLLPDFATTTKLASYTWRADGPAFKPFGDSLSPTLRITSRSVPGTGGGDTSQLPPQCAISVTEVTAAHYTEYGVGVPGKAPGTGRTQLRNRWGRFYLPAPQSATIMAGRFMSARCTAWSNAVKTFYNLCTAAQFVPVMYSPTIGSAYSIDEIHVDDIVDVIRSRRYTTPTTRAANTITPPA